MKNIHITCAEANLRLREIKDLIKHTVKPLAEVQEVSSVAGILYALGDSLEQHGAYLKQLSREVVPMKLTPPPPVKALSDLPSSIPADEEPESLGYHSGVHQAMQYAQDLPPDSQ